MKILLYFRRKRYYEQYFRFVSGTDITVRTKTVPL